MLKERSKTLPPGGFCAAAVVAESVLLVVVEEKARSSSIDERCGLTESDCDRYSG